MSQEAPYYPRTGCDLPINNNGYIIEGKRPYIQGGPPSSVPTSIPGYSSYQEPLHGGTAAVPRYRGSLSSSVPYRQLLTNQNVKVLVEARGWVIGIIVGVLKAVDAVTHWGYRVRYMSGKRELEGDFPMQNVIPLAEQ